MFVLSVFLAFVVLLRFRSEHKYIKKYKIVTLRLKTICSTEYQNNFTVVKQNLLERKKNEDNLNKQMGKVDLI